MMYKLRTGVESVCTCMQYTIVLVFIHCLRNKVQIPHLGIQEHRWFLSNCLFCLPFPHSVLWSLRMGYSFSETIRTFLLLWVLVDITHSVPCPSCLFIWPKFCPDLKVQFKGYYYASMKPLLISPWRFFFYFF